MENKNIIIALLVGLILGVLAGQYIDLGFNSSSAARCLPNAPCPKPLNVL